MKRKGSYKAAIIILLLTALSVTAFITINKYNAYHDYLENRVFGTSIKWFDINFDSYSELIDETISEETIDLKTVTQLNSTYTYGHDQFLELSHIAEVLKGADLNSNRILDKLSEISTTLTLLKQEVEENGTNTLKLSQDQVKFLTNIKAFNSIFKDTLKEYSEVDGEEFFEYDNQYWIEYLSKISKRSDSIIIYNVY
ncbi:hypothetical protein [Halobacillus halophilus]|uniref:hypothetical protein n=1 Tax=Halobacillus halophilus TaxID=1570 RepID=UPI001CD58402|nr:hypothetical protein [Halobacillus halophilus]MCA1011407.1 hypothetical protein [Halobacillus halophilus]